MINKILIILILILILKNIFKINFNSKQIEHYKLTGKKIPHFEWNPRINYNQKHPFFKRGVIGLDTTYKTTWINPAILTPTARSTLLYYNIDFN